MTLQNASQKNTASDNKLHIAYKSQTSQKFRCVSI